MARQKDRDLAEISRLSSELELSTFLNKGVLQTNSEYKLRIVELERENAVLRVAESRLARTEDRLEAVEKKLEGEREGRRVVEGEREELRERLARAERRLEAIGKLAIREDQNVGPLAQKKLPSSSQRAEKARSPMTSPTQPVLAARKRRRVHGTPPGANDEKTPSPSPPPQRPSSLPHHRVTQPSTMRPNRPRTSGSAKKRDSRVIDDDDKVFQVKIEDESRRRPHSVDVDSDDDPLAML